MLRSIHIETDHSDPLRARQSPSNPFWSTTGLANEVGELLLAVSLCVPVVLDAVGMFGSVQVPDEAL
jgi:hypothetical protein